MFGKLLFIIVVVGAVACALLVIRQQRIDTFHSMTQVHGRLLEHERTLWQMRADIAQRCRPSQVRLAMNQIDVNWVPLPALPPGLLPPDVRLAAHGNEPREPRISGTHDNGHARPDM